MYTFLIILFVLVCFVMVVVILLQSGKGQGLAGAFGGVSGGAIFGGRGAATFLSKATTVLAVIYMMLSLLIGYMYKMNTSSGQPESLIQQKVQQGETQPAVNLPVAPLPQTPTDTGK